jgi:hypothetical protein
MRDVLKELLQPSIEKAVSQKLGSFARQFERVTDGWSAAERQKAALEVLDMMESACSAFITKTRESIVTASSEQ